MRRICSTRRRWRCSCERFVRVLERGGRGSGGAGRVTSSCSTTASGRRCWRGGTTRTGSRCRRRTLLGVVRRAGRRRRRMRWRWCSRASRVDLRGVRGAGESAGAVADRRVGVGPESLVAVAMRRSLDLVVGDVRGGRGRVARMCRWIRIIRPSGSRTCSTRAAPVCVLTTERDEFECRRATVGPADRHAGSVGVLGCGRSTDADRRGAVAAGNIRRM